MKIEQLIPELNCKYGAPMGRANLLTAKKEFINQVTGETFTTISGSRIFDKRVPMSSCGAYDKGGAYWGIGKQLRVKFNKELTYIEFYRVE